MNQLPVREILVVDDDDDIREVLVEMLEGEGFRATPAIHGQAALDYLNKCSKLPDLILIDLMMPVKNAGEFRTEQMNHPRYGEIPVVLMSADANLRDKMEEHRFVYGTKKPFDMDDLLTKIRSLVN